MILPHCRRRHYSLRHFAAMIRHIIIAASDAIAITLMPRYRAAAAIMPLLPFRHITLRFFFDYSPFHYAG